MKRRFQQILRNKLIKNTGWMVFSQLYQMVISLVIGVISTRYLGPTNYGIINYTASFVSFFSIICSLGMEAIVVKEMIDDREHEGVILGSAIALRFISGIISMGCVCLIVTALNRDDPAVRVVALLQSIAIVFNSFSIIDSWYQSYLNSKVSTIIKCIAYTVMSVYKVYLLVSGKDVRWFAFSTSLDSIVIAVLFFFTYTKDSVHKLKISLKTGINTLGKSYHLIISSLMAVLYSQMDRVMIGTFIGKTEVGYYAAAALIANLWVFVPQAVCNSAQPLLMDKGKSKEEFSDRLSKLICVVFWFGVLVAIIITLMSSIIIGILYGKNYQDAKLPLMILIWSTSFSILSYARGIWMINYNKQYLAKYIAGTGALVNLVLNAILIHYFGMVGAAIATLITEFICAFIVPGIIAKEYEAILLNGIMYPLSLIRK